MRLWMMWTDDGKPYIGQFVDGKRVHVRSATDADLHDMTEGRLSYDGQTDPATAAWARHVANGGD